MSTLAKGEADRDTGITTADHAADFRIKATIDTAIEDAIASGRVFSVNDIRDRIPAASDNLIGARFRGYAAKRVDGKPLMVKAGHTTTTSDRGHAREIKTWIGYAAYLATQGGTR